jgi:hypothetical protein
VGNETFEAGWKDNENAKIAFSSTDLSPVDYDRVVSATLNLLTGAFTHFTDIPAGGNKLTAQVTVAVGTGSTTTITVVWDDPVSVVHNDSFPLAPLTNVGRAFDIALPPEMPADILSASQLALFTAGELTFFIGKNVAEKFEEGWPAPTQGLE